MKKNYALIVLLFAINLLMAQGTDNTKQQPSIIAKKTTEPIRLDGILDEEIWYAGRPADNFWGYFPTDTLRSESKTEVFIAYSDTHVYIAAKCYSDVQDYIIPSLRRDFRAGGSDNITFIIDPFNDRTNAFVFGTNPYGVLREALLSNGCQNFDTDWDDSWDNKWAGASTIHDGYWSCELAIPLTTLRFKEGATSWNFNCYRFDTQANTRSTWNHVPQNQLIANLAYLGKIEWETPLKKAKSSIAVIPYVTANTSQNFEEGEAAENGFAIGGDAKIAVTPGLNLDLTINPDFSQVEVDQQVINLDRFEIFFPERRQFFLENADLFGSFGESRINPFFSRRIGVSRDTTTGQNIANPILAGARLSGKLDNNWRIGLLNMQTANDEDNGLPSFNYTVGAVQRKLFSRSNVGMIFVNKQTFEDVDEENEEINKYSRVVGLDYNLASADNRWVGKTFYHQGFSPDGDDGQFAHGTRLEYRIRPFSVRWQHQWVGENYEPEVGFVPRRNYFSINPEMQFFFYPLGEKLNQHNFGMRSFFLWTPGESKTDHRVEFFWQANFNNTSEFNVTLQNEYIFLLEDFDPTRSDATPLPGQQDYTFTSFQLNYRSDQRPKLNYNIQPSVGQFFNGYQYGVGGSLSYRYQPFGQVTLNFNYSYIDLPDPYAQTSLFLIGPRIDFTFTKKIFLTTFIQYNDQLENVNVNARFQWRFAPVSDFFLVYTDNYMSNDFSVRNRAIVAKFTYWLNL